MDNKPLMTQNKKMNNIFGEIKEINRLQRIN